MIAAKVGASEGPISARRQNALVRRVASAASWLLIAALLAVGWVGFHGEAERPLAPDATPSAREPLDWRASREEILASVQSLTDEAASAEAEIWQGYIAEHDGVSRKGRIEIERGVEESMARFMRGGEVGGVVWDCVSDIRGKTSKARARAGRNATPLVSALQRADAEEFALLRDVENRLTLLNGDYLRQVGQVIERPVPALAEPEMQTIQTLLARLPVLVSTDVGGSAAMVAIEAACFKSTTRSAEKVAAWLMARIWPKAARLVTTAALPVADGPLPFGDMAAVGFGAWTAHDIITLRGKLRGEIQAQLWKSAGEHRSHSSAQIVAHIKGLSAASRSLRTDTLEEVRRALTPEISQTPTL